MTMRRLLTFMGLMCIELVAGWVEVGGSMFPEGSSGSVVDLSDDGRRLAVGSSSQDNGRGCISVYELDLSGDHWQLLVEIHGMPGEGLGDALALSPDGLLVAARRHHVTPNAIQVFQIIETGPAIFLYDFVGPLVYCPVDGNGTSVPLALALGPVSQYLLLSSCEDFDSQRGMVQAYILDRGTFLGSNDVSQWTPYLPALTGAQQGDRFGHATAIVHAPHIDSPSGSILRVAVAAPYHDRERGSAQVFLAQESGWSQLGQSIVGIEVGEQMGFALDMSSTEVCYLAVGSPGAHLGSEFISQGSVKVFHWRAMPLEEVPIWYTVGVLKPPGDFVGHAVSISRDGHRIATGSYDKSRGDVVLYEMNNFDTFRGIDLPIFEYEQGHNFGASLTMNAHGSLLAVTGHQQSEGSGMASVWIDSSPFCQVQLFANNFVAESVWDSYLRRQVCRDETTIIDGTESCEATFILLDGQWASCAWEDRSLPQVLEIDMTPSVTPHDSDATTDGIMPSCVPSFNADITSPVPPHEPTSTIDPEPFPSENSTLSEGYNSFDAEAPSSQSPSDDNSFGEPFVAVCRCDEQGFCINQSLPQQVDMRLCLRVSSRVHKPISVLRLDLSQPDYLVVMIDEYLPVADKHLVQTCKDSICTITMSAPVAFYDEARPPFMTISGRIALIRTYRLKLPSSVGIMDTTVTFEIDIELAHAAGSQSGSIDGNKNTPVVDSHTASIKDKPNVKLYVAIGGLLGSLALLGIFGFEVYVARNRS